MFSVRNNFNARLPERSLARAARALATRDGFDRGEGVSLLLHCVLHGLEAHAVSLHLRNLVATQARRFRLSIARRKKKPGRLNVAP